MTKPTITQAAKEDLPAILDVQRKSFLEVCRVYHLASLPPLEQTLESLSEEFEKGVVLKASLPRGMPSLNVLDSRRLGNDDKVMIVGSVRAYQEGDSCHIGRLIVLPEYQNQGIGKALMREIESQYRHRIKRFELFTGASDLRNRHLYDRLGYKPFKTEKLNSKVTFVFMEKMVI